MDRREFFKTVLRISALGGLSLLGVKAMRGAAGSGAGGAAPAGRSEAAGDAAGGTAGGPLSGQTCTADWICARCASVPGCGLPQALSYRQARGS